MSNRRDAIGKQGKEIQFHGVSALLVVVELLLHSRVVIFYHPMLIDTEAAHPNITFLRVEGLRMTKVDQGIHNISNRIARIIHCNNNDNVSKE